MKILFLTPWYPSDKDAMSGLFVQKHVEAVRAQGVDVQVIHSRGWWDMWRKWKRLQRTWGMPDLVQLNILQKQGTLALWLKEHFHIPYIIIEHWSGYLPENGKFRSMPDSKQKFLRRVAREAEMVLTVSVPLQRAMQACGIQAKRWGTIDNVVDDFFYEPSAFSRQHSERKTLLHVSCFDERAKNVKGLLRAAKMLSEQRRDWRLVIIGTGVDYQEVRDYAASLAFPEGILEWTGELTPREVAERMHASDALVLSSRYETYGVVLAEAAAAGIPILSTPVGIAEDLISAGGDSAAKGLLVPQEIAQNKAGTFAQFMETVLWKPTPNPSLKGREFASPDTERFTAQAIGTKLKNIYDSCLHRDI